MLFIKCDDDLKDAYVPEIIKGKSIEKDKHTNQHITTPSAHTSQLIVNHLGQDEKPMYNVDRKIRIRNKY